jgi:epoxyqueuosine reductase QueG
MGNSGNKNFIPDLQKLAAEPDTVVAEHAAWALKKLADEPR